MKDGLLSIRIVLFLYISQTLAGIARLLLEGQESSSSSSNSSSSSGSSVDLTDASDELVKALETAVAREGQQGENSAEGPGRHQERGVTQCLTRCIVAATRARARQDARLEPARGGGGGASAAGGTAGLGVMATLLALNRGLLYPALSHEATSFVSRFDADPREAVGVVCPLASALLLQPECERSREGVWCNLWELVYASSPLFCPRGNHPRERLPHVESDVSLKLR